MLLLQINVRSLLVTMKSKDRIAVCSRSFSKNTTLRQELFSLYENVTFNDDGIKLEGDSLVDFLKDEVLNKRSQDLDVYYRLNGAIYICKTNRLLDEKTFFVKDNIYAYKMDRENSIDIDDIIDYKFVEYLMNEKTKISSKKNE